MCGNRWILQELKHNLAKELDFRTEARNAQRLSSCMADRRRVAIPKPVPQVVLLLFLFLLFSSTPLGKSITILLLLLFCLREYGNVEGSS